MSPDRAYFFCGVGGSGMLPLALIVQARGFPVEGSDRSYDQGRTAAKFEFLSARGIRLHPQDGSGVTSPHQTVVASAAVETTIPDIQAARAHGAAVMTRPELLSELFNSAPLAVGVAGTSGKSTTTGMIGWILHVAGRSPTVMNGAEMKNFVTSDTPFASALVGDGDVFVSEVDESDGSIARYRPKVAVVNNISLDHKSMEELRNLFSAFVAKADKVVLNLDNDETRALVGAVPQGQAITYSLEADYASVRARNIAPRSNGMSFDAIGLAGETVSVALQVPGRHNVSNALAAIAAALACGVSLSEAANALNAFKGIRRRLDVVGTAKGVTVIDDFAHNPDKIAATLETLHAFPGRLLIMFQPHGYGPLRHMGQALIDEFANRLGPDDVLLMPDPVYYGGTVERTVSSRDITTAIAAQGRHAEAYADRPACGDRLIALARPGDRIIVMGARDDTLSQFAAELLERLA
jgi:UDP-N-acetylmuramate--alanine ligase